MNTKHSGTILVYLVLLMLTTGCCDGRGVITTVLTDIAITPTTASVAVGETKQFTAIGSYSDSTTADITSLVSWSTNNASVASINATGLVTAEGVGTTVISASSGGVASNAAELTVNPLLAPIGVFAVSSMGQ